MSKDYELFHYYCDITKPWSSLTDEQLSSAKEYAYYSEYNSNIKMDGYSEHYFKKRLAVENKCKSILEQKYGKTLRDHPIYMTLGREDLLFFKKRHHKFSISLPISMFDKEKILFIIGDSIGSSIPVEDRCYSFSELLNLSVTQILDIFDHTDIERYIEVQIWDDSVDEMISKSSNHAYYACVANFQDYVFDSSLDVKINELKHKGVFELFKTTLYHSKKDIIPPGNIHGIPHSVRCAFLAFCIACDLNLSHEDSIWAAQCAAYHDCGRLFAKEETHGIAAIYAIHDTFEETDWDAALSVISHHNQTLKKIDCLPTIEGKRPVQIIAKIVHDADVLDYVRFSSEYGIQYFDPHHLILQESKSYVSLAYELYMWSVMQRNWITKLF